MSEIYLVLIIALAAGGLLFYFLKIRKSNAEPQPEQIPSPAQRHTIDDLNRAIQESKSNIEIPRQVSATDQLRRNLMTKVGHDQAKVERLVEYEKKLRPNLSEVEQFRAAIERWEDDNR
jgi:hypothetical protein